MKKTLVSLIGMLMYAGLSCATNINQVVVFGDSLSDTGNLYEYMQHNLPLSPPYFGGRFSNGPLWIDLLMKNNYRVNANSHLLDYAIGGAGILPEEDDDGMAFTLKRELNDYFVDHAVANPNALYFVWIGSNNFLSIPDDPENDLHMTIDGITRGVVRLLDNGAKNIVILNLPDLGKTPAAIEDDEVEVLTDLSKKFNSLLENETHVLQSSYKDANIMYFDVLNSFDDIVENPRVYGFTNIDSSCYIDDEPASTLNSIPKIAAALRQTNRNCDGYLFFDIVHPTTKAHGILQDKLEDFLHLHDIIFTE